jgi:hypothetical protein
VPGTHGEEVDGQLVGLGQLRYGESDAASSCDSFTSEV